MKTMFNAWVLLGALVSVAVSQGNYESQHIAQDAYHESEAGPYHPSSRQHHQTRSYEAETHEEISRDPSHYQSLEARYHKHEPEAYSRQQPYHGAQQHHQQYYARQPQHVAPQYYQPEDPSYHRPQEIAYHQSPQHYRETPQHEESYQGSSHYSEPEGKENDSEYKTEEPQYTEPPRPSSPSRPRPIPTDPKLPLYFTMYEKRVIQDPTDKYGKGPWRYLTYGHGITYGSKEPGKVFEKGYGYIRALGRDHCKLPEHLCPPKNEKPFDYEGRKEPYFGYRPH